MVWTEWWTYPFSTCHFMPLHWTKAQCYYYTLCMFLLIWFCTNVWEYILFVYFCFFFSFLNMIYIYILYNFLDKHSRPCKTCCFAPKNQSHERARTMLLLLFCQGLFKFEVRCSLSLWWPLGAVQMWSFRPELQLSNMKALTLKSIFFIDCPWDL